MEPLQMNEATSEVIELTRSEATDMGHVEDFKPTPDDRDGGQIAAFSQLGRLPLPGGELNQHGKPVDTDQYREMLSLPLRVTPACASAWFN
jgi:hypothetical protein